MRTPSTRRVPRGWSQGLGPVAAGVLAAALATSCGNGSGGGGASTTHSVTLQWDAPQTNADGTPLVDLEGFRIYSGTQSGVYTGTRDVGNVTRYKVTKLDAGTYYFVVTAYDTFGNESGFSNEVAATVPRE